MKGTKRLAAAITTLFAAGALALSASAAAAHNYKGDINRDDKVNITDLVCLNKHFQGVSYIPEENIVYADMDGNGRLNVIDFMFLKMAALSDDEPEEIEITAPEETTPAVTTKTTAAATTAVTTKTTAATTKVTTAATTKAATTSTTKAAAVTTTTTASSTNKTSSATTTTTTTSTTTASSAATTTTTTTTTKATSATTTTTTATTTTTTAPTIIGDGINTVAATDVARGFVVFQGDAESYDYVKDANQYIPGSVCMPAITKDDVYTSKYRFIEPPVTNFYAFLSILQPNSYHTYGSDSGVTVEIKSAKVDGETVDVSGLTQEADGAKVNISDILTNSRELEITYEVKGIDSSSVSGSSGGSSESNPSTPSSGSTRTVKLNSSAIALSPNSNNELSLAGMINDGEEVEDIVLNIKSNSDSEIGIVQFKFHTDWGKSNSFYKDVNETITGQTNAYSLASVLSSDDKEKMSCLTSSDKLYIECYYMGNQSVTIDSIELILK